MTLSSEKFKENTKKVVANNKIVIVAIIVRLVALIVIYLTRDHLAGGFVGSDTYYDDFRYEAGGEYYARVATSIIDIPAFTRAYASVGDWVGYKLQNPFTSTPLWYWIVCVIMYVFKTKWVVRIFNIFFASISIFYIYDFVNNICGEEIAEKTSWLMALLPYPVIFSCFSYKDQFVMFITFYLLDKAVRYKYYGSLKIRELLTGVLLALLLLLTRSGLTAILLAICFFIAFSNLLNSNEGISRKEFFIIPIALIVILLLMYRFSSTIGFKLGYYINRHEETLTNTSISFITINSFRDIYKLPFTYLFSMIMPINLFGKIDSWYAIVSNINIIMCPISVGAFLEIFKRKYDKAVYWGCMILYLVSIIASINIFRHYYSLIPITLMNYSSFRQKVDDKNYILYLSLTFGFIALLLMFYGFRG